MRWLVFLCISSSSLLAQGDSSIRLSDSFETHIVAINRLLLVADKQIGVPYVYGGCSPKGFDCSGFIKYCYQISLNRTIPHRSIEISQMGVSVSRQDAIPGDIVAFTGRSINGKVAHVGMVYEVSNEAVYFIHSSSSKGIRVDRINSTYWQERFLDIRHILD